MFDVIKYSTYFNIHLFKKIQNKKKKNIQQSQKQNTKEKYVKEEIIFLCT